MRITFIDNFSINFGYAYLSSILKLGGQKILHHVYAFPKYKGIDIYLKPERYFDFNTIAENIVHDESDVICFSVFSSNYFFYKNLIDRLKSKSDIPVVVGGVLCSLKPELFVPRTKCDCIIIGEAELIISDLLTRITSKKNKEDIRDVPGVMFEDPNGNIYQNDQRRFCNNLDELPYPDRSLFGNTMGSLYILTSRGCFYPCTYCCASEINKKYGIKNLRKRSVDSVIEEIKFEIDRENYERIFFYDDLFINNKKWFNEFVEKYKKTVKLPYYCCVNPLIIDEEIVQGLSESNARSVQIGIQSVNEGYKRKFLKRRETNSKIVEAINLMKQYNVNILVDFIFNLPGETEDDLKKSLDFVLRHNPTSIQVNFLCYYPGSALARIAYDSGLITRDLFDRAEKNELIGEQSYLGAIVDKYDSRMQVQYAMLVKISRFTPPIVINWLCNLGLHKFFPVNRWVYYFISILAELRGNGLDYLKIILNLSFNKRTGEEKQL